MTYKFKLKNSLITKLTIVKILFMISLSFYSINSYAKLTQSVDRTDIHAGESFVLTLQVDEDTGAQPDLSLIPKEFTILSNSQYQNMSFINGVSNVIKGWKIKLSTLATGKISIPSITVGKESSKAINLFIKDTSNRVDVGGQKKAIYLETTVDHPKVFVQQQILFTVNLYRAINTHYARLSEPDAGESIVEKLGDDVQYDKTIDGTRYVVTERRYAIFPQKSGKLTIESINFTADINDSSQRSNSRFLSTTRPISVNSKNIDVEVLPQPAEASNPWMPASEVILVDKWSNSGTELTVGEPVTWTILLYAQGLSESQLGEVVIPKIKGLQFYPDTAQKERQINDKGVLGQRIEKLAVIPSKVGTITIPEIKIKWWDTNSTSEKTAALPAKTFTVVAGEKSENASIDVDKIGPEIKTIKVVDTEQLYYWKSAAVVFLFLWLITLLFYVRNRRLPSSSTRGNSAGKKHSHAKNNATATQSELRNRLSKALKNGTPLEIESLLLKWSSAIAQNSFRSLGQLAANIEDDKIVQKIKDLDASRYSNSEALESCDINNSDLQVIENSLTQSTQEKEGNTIPPLYPR